MRIIFVPVMVLLLIGFFQPSAQAVTQHRYDFIWNCLSTSTDKSTSFRSNVLTGAERIIHIAKRGYGCVGQITAINYTSNLKSKLLIYYLQPDNTGSSQDARVNHPVTLGESRQIIGHSDLSTGPASEVTVNQPPTTSITFPYNGGVGLAGSTATIQATASDPDGSISKVEFYVNGSYLGEDASAPYTISYPGIEAGVYSLTTKAYDNLSSSSTSAPVTVTIHESSAGVSGEAVPEDLSFIVGQSAGAPAVGTNKLVLLGIKNWKVRLYRGRLKQPSSNDGSGIYFSKVPGSDTLYLHGDTWHSGELVQLEFYRPYGSLDLGPTLLTQTGLWEKVTSWGERFPESVAGKFASDGTGHPYFTTKKFAGNGYLQFKLNWITGGSLYVYLKDASGNMWEIEYHPGFNSNKTGVQIRCNNTNITVLPNTNLTSLYLRLKRTGNLITLETSPTELGVYSAVYTFPQLSDPTKVMSAGGISSGVGNGVVNGIIAGETLITN